jgi:general secretion pathway protein G
MKKSAFTIVEMMVVLIVIGILMSLSVGVAIKILGEAKKGQAEADITALEAAISRYERDVGSYPPSGGSGLYYYLEADRSGDTTGWEGAYIDFDEDRTSGNNYVDPWGTSYQYLNPGSPTRNPDFVDIWSTGSGSTIGNW